MSGEECVSTGREKVDHLVDSRLFPRSSNYNPGWLFHPARLADASEMHGTAAAERWSPYEFFLAQRVYHRYDA